ncbi:MAG: hypothetical protein R3Y05_01245 [bacterium]
MRTMENDFDETKGWIIEYKRKSRYKYHQVAQNTLKSAVSNLANVKHYLFVTKGRKVEYKYYIMNNNELIGYENVGKKKCYLKEKIGVEL